jgi:hypothetical protein
MKCWKTRKKKKTPNKNRNKKQSRRITGLFFKISKRKQGLPLRRARSPGERGVLGGAEDTEATIKKQRSEQGVVF